ncbi:hypothetical protein [Gordonia sp. (in: high G+C Gram-positive bacteria)]|uniref:TPR repeat region-containing protein n=1 Tax=Gordonia sp. (in: high G+C Gram-positive bacteria) TaxID=84139 RepID=UPI0035B3A065
MNRPSRSTVNGWDVLSLDNAANKLDTAVSLLLRQTQKMVDAPMIAGDSQAWVGASQRGCESRTQSDRTEINKIGTELSAAANVLRNTSTAISANRNVALTRSLALEMDRFEVHDDWSVTDTRDYSSELRGVEAGSAAENSILTERADRASEATNARLSLQGLADQMGVDDRNGATALATAFAGADANAPVTSAYSPQTAKTDWLAIMQGTATAEQRERFARATQLTTEQRAALARGEHAVIPKEQLDYLKAFYEASEGGVAGLPRGLDAQAAFGDHFGGLESDALKRQFADGLYLLGNPRVRTEQRLEPGFLAGPLQTLGLTPPQRFVAGGVNELPPSVRDLLTKSSVSERDVSKSMTLTGHYADIENFHSFKKLMDILDHRSMDPGQSNQLGSDIDRALISRASEIAGGGNGTDAYSIGDDEIAHGDVEKLLRRMVDNAGSDHIAVHDALMGRNGSAAPLGSMPEVFDLNGKASSYNASDAMRRLLTFDWSDDVDVDGVGVGSDGVNRLFNWMPDVAIPQDGSPEAVAASERAGHVASELARIFAENRTELVDIGDDKLAIGELNPELTQTLAKALAPYTPELAGTDPDIFGTLGTSSLDSAYELKSVFQVLDSDPVAGRIFNSMAAIQVDHIQELFGADPTRASLGTFAGRIEGAMTGGMQAQIDNDTEDSRSHAVKAYTEHGAMYDSGKALVSAVPGLGPVVKAILDVSAPEAKLEFVGLPPGQGTGNAELSALDSQVFKSTSTEAQYVQMLEGHLRAHPDLVDDPDFRSMFPGRGEEFFERLRTGGTLPPSSVDIGKVPEFMLNLPGAEIDNYSTLYDPQFDRARTATEHREGW